MITLLYILIAILVFGLLIFIHEGGHFLAARICKVTVNEFSIGMGPKLFSKRSKKSNTLYSLRALPIGGYVSMDGEDESSENPDAFCNKSVPKRMFIVLAGAFMNLLLGFILMFMLVFSQEFLLSTRIGAFNENSLSAEKLMIGDEVRRVEGARVHTGDELIYEIMNEGDKPIDLVVIRDGEEVLLEDVVFPNFVDSGVTFGEIDFKVYSEEATFGNYIKHAFYRSCSTVKMIYDSIFNLISGKYGMEAVSGPVGVTEVVGDAAKSGFSNLVYVVCVVSINLGVFNLLPIPALDGGKFAFLAVEAIIRRPINKKFEAYVNFIGIVLLFGLMIFVTFKDIIKLILR
ncbi:MAG: RIP metalloprotease RseP [Ruminococcaceae bacterium]|nr:RIP metalloprotease RseP [Oscillospiraceae bacterium]